MSTETSHGRTWRRQRWAFAGIVLLATVFVAIFLNQSDSTAESGTSRTQQVIEGKTLLTHPCATSTSKPFVPQTISMPGVVAASPVVALPRDARGVPSVLPTDNTGMRQFAWDEGPVGILPGSARGNTLFNAHTWPWPAGGALGNQMLTNLKVGGLIIVSGKDVTQCYRVTKRVETPAQGPYHDFYNRTGPPQIAFISCSGERLGQGNWQKRTIWFASPVTDPTIT